MRDKQNIAEKGGEGKGQKINCIIWLFGPPLIGFLNGVCCGLEDLWMALLSYTAQTILLLITLSRATSSSSFFSNLYG